MLFLLVACGSLSTKFFTKIRSKLPAFSTLFFLSFSVPSVVPLQASVAMNRCFCCLKSQSCSLVKSRRKSSSKSAELCMLCRISRWCSIAAALLETSLIAFLSLRFAHRAGKFRTMSKVQRFTRMLCLMKPRIPATLMASFEAVRIDLWLLAFC